MGEFFDRLILAFFLSAFAFFSVFLHTLNETYKKHWKTPAMQGGDFLEKELLCPPSAKQRRCPKFWLFSTVICLAKKVTVQMREHFTVYHSSIGLRDAELLADIFNYHGSNPYLG